MHVVLWTVAGQRYATPTGQVIEVIPPVESRPLPDSPPWLRGLIDFRSQLIPLVDVPSLLGHGGWPLRMASRIIVVTTENEQDGTDGLRALLVQSVLGGDELDFTNRVEIPSSSSPNCRFLGPMTLTDAGVVQLTHPDRIAWET